MILKPVRQERVSLFLNGLSLFGIGESWGGYESLCIPCSVQRTVATGNTVGSSGTGPLLRFHIGLEDPDDLIADLMEGFRAFAQA